MDKLRNDLRGDREDLWQEEEDMVGHQYEHPFSPGESPSYYIDTDLENCEEKMRGETTGKST